MTTSNRIIILVAFFKYNLNVRKYKIFIFFNKCLVLFVNFYILLLLGNNS
jgi:hypothetical protein